MRLTSKIVPKTPKMHLVYRYFMVQQTRNPARAKAIVAAFRRDALLYINSAVWLHEPRNSPNCIPFNTFVFQDDLVRDIVRSIEDSGSAQFATDPFDVGVDKSRTMGITWTVLAVMDWLWRCRAGSQMLMISKKEDDVDKRGDKSKLMPKLDHIEECMPSALRVRGRNHDANHGRGALFVYNPKNGSSIGGESSNPDAGRSGRYLLVFRDEEGFALYGERISAGLTSTTRMQVRVSTPNGTANSFYRAKKAGKIKWHTFHWSLHPEYRKGAYSIKGNRIRLLDAAWHERFQAKEGRKYPCRRDATYADPGAEWEYLRSPWFDRQCDRFDNEPTKIAQELQVGYLGSGLPYFPASELEKLKEKHRRNPNWEGGINQLIGGVYNDSDVRPHRAKCWFDPIAKKPPQRTTYTVGVDIGTGTGRSDTAWCVIDDTTKEKVFEFFSNHILPEKAARLTLTLCDFFETPEGPAFLAWDQGGPGLPFGATIVEVRPGMIYYWKPADERGARKAGARCAWYAASQGRGLRLYRTALYNGQYVSHSENTYVQAAEYIYGPPPAGAPLHAAAADQSIDNANRGEQHGDILVSEVVAWVATLQRPPTDAKEKESHFGTFWWRREQHRQGILEATQTSTNW